MTLSVYLAGASADIDRARRWRDHLVAHGIAVVSTWIDVVTQVGDANPRDVSRQDRLSWTLADYDEVDRCGLFWFLVPTPPASTRGAWCELGYATRQRKGIICSGDTTQSIFTAVGAEYATDEEAAAEIVKCAEERR